MLDSSIVIEQDSRVRVADETHADVIMRRIAHSSVGPEKTEEVRALVESLPQKAQQALDFATTIHEGEFRKTGEPYIYHVLEVTRLLKANFNTEDEDVLSASILHDTIEDKPLSVNRHMLKQVYGDRVASMVDGLSKFKINDIVYDDVTHGHLFVVALKEPAILLIKMADRLHNMQTVAGLSPAKRVENCEETRDFYIPLAEKFGFTEIAESYRKLISPFVSLEHSPSNTDRWINLVHPHLKAAVAELSKPRTTEIDSANLDSLRTPPEDRLGSRI